MKIEIDGREPITVHGIETRFRSGGLMLLEGYAGTHGVEITLSAEEETALREAVTEDDWEIFEANEKKSSVPARAVWPWPWDVDPGA